jgi:hypothetical protein
LIRPTKRAVVEQAELDPFPPPKSLALKMRSDAR